MTRCSYPLLIIFMSLLLTACSQKDATTVTVPDNWRPSIARNGMLALLNNDAEALEDLRALALACQQAEADQTARHIDDQIALLEVAAGLELDIQDITLDEAALWHAESLQAQYPVFRIEQMRRQDRYNRLAQTFNFSTEAASALARLSPAGILRTAIDTVFLPARLQETSTHQRRALDLLTRLRYEALAVPQPQDAPELARHRANLRMALAELRPYEEKLRKKIMHAQARDAFAAARWLMGNGDNLAARNLLKTASQQHPDDVKIQDLLIEVSAKISAANRLHSETLTPPSVVHTGEHARLLRVVMAEGQHRQAGLLARNLAQQGRDELRDDAALVVAIGAKGTLDNDLRHLLEISTGNAARHYRLLLKNGVGSSKYALEDAARLTNRAKMAYIFLGLKPLEKAPKAKTTRERAYGVTTAAGLLWPVQWVLRGALSKFRPVVSDESWRHAAASILLRSQTLDHLNAEQKQLAMALADSYMLRKRFDEARFYFRMAGVEDMTELETKHAKYLLQTAMATEDLRSKAILLDRLKDKYPESEVGSKAQAALDTLRQTVGGPVEKLAANLPRALIRQQWQWFEQMRIPELTPALADGEKDNGEIDKSGMSLFETQPPVLHYVVRNGDGTSREVRHELTAQQFENFQNGLDVVAGRIRGHRRAEALYDRLAVPFELRASAGPGGFDAQPRLQTIQLPPEQVVLYE